MKLATASLALACALCASCASSGPSKGVSAPKLNPTSRVYLVKEPEFNSMFEIAEAFPKASIKGTVVDFKGAELNGKKMKHYPARQDERNPPVKWAVPGLELRNFIARDIPGGFYFSKPKCKMYNGTFIDVGEDAFSTNETGWGLNADKIRIYNNSGEGDKSAQFNGADKGSLTNCYITGGITAVRIEKKGYNNKNVTFTSSNNTFEDVPTAHNVSGDTKVSARGNTYIKVHEMWVLDKDTSASYTEEK